MLRYEDASSTVPLVVPLRGSCREIVQDCRFPHLIRQGRRRDHAWRLQAPGGSQVRKGQEGWTVLNTRRPGAFSANRPQQGLSPGDQSDMNSWRRYLARELLSTYPGWTTALFGCDGRRGGCDPRRATRARRERRAPPTEARFAPPSCNTAGIRTSRSKTTET